MISKEQLVEYKKKYAHLIIVAGLNDIKGRICKINADLDDPEMVSYCVKEMYDRGARRVEVFWTYRPVLKTIYKYTSKEELCLVKKPELTRLKFELDESMPSLTLESWDPNWMDGIDANKIVEAKAAHAVARHPYKEKMDAVETPWCLAAVPGKEWAKRLFPNLSSEKALMKMWEKTLECVRCLDGDPIKNWKNFNDYIKARARWLNSLNIKSLHYTSKKTGTDLIVGINPYAHYVGGAHDSIGNPPYNPNMPAVETFTSPDRLVTEGIAVASKPLCHDGQLIDGFSIRFHKGRIVEVHAKKGEAMLKGLIDTDEGSHYLGEAALVPYDSPVSNTKTIYYNTLFDENAACHLAFGNSLMTTYGQEVRELNEDELIKKGLNRSSIHMDFMIGTKDLNIVATTRTGKKVQIFKDGNWAVDL